MTNKIAKGLREAREGDPLDFNMRMKDAHGKWHTLTRKQRENWWIKFQGSGLRVKYEDVI